ncbi:MAG TPA: sugar phosphate nucleotidyltransferase [Dongiaceae bacterium]|nr:sugar phosphate nucleotidyltransferase [Dongiaceae bacterium]
MWEGHEMREDTTLGGPAPHRPALVILAAGMGSRYGGLKQVDPVGPSGETIMDYSVYDALRAGFGGLVFVIRRDLEQAFRETLGARFEKRVPVAYVFQELDRLPTGFAPPPNRRKPWGTGHAILMAEEVIREPFGVINADDFYGRHSYGLLARHLQSASRDYAMVGFVLRNTLSEFGAVARGVCRTTADDFLEEAAELTRIEREGSAAKYTDPGGTVHPLTGAETVSLNMWGFRPTIFTHLRRELVSFLEVQAGNEKAEFFIPTVVTALVTRGQERLKVLRTPDSWFGITYKEDRPRVMENLRRLIGAGEYPDNLWG